MKYVHIFRCPNPNCIRSEKEPLKGMLRLVDAKYKKGLIYRGTLKCSTCAEEFEIRDGVPNLLPQRIKKCLGQKVCDSSLSSFDKEIVYGIRWSGTMVRSYHENVVDPFSSALGARYIERYEDLYIDEVLDKYLKNKKVKVIFIEMGVGTGRYLIRYGARLLNSEITSKSFSLPFMSRGLKSKVCKKYRDDRILRKYYSYDAYYDQNLQLLIGIDFQEQMIKRCKENLKEMKLYSLFGERILLCTAAAQYFNLSFDQFDELKDSFKIVTCVFQTLGNQKEELQIELLKTLKRLASPKGIIIVSVFNKKMFEEFGLKRFYSIEVAPTVGELKEDEEALELRKKGILLTRQGVYSQWFSEEELKKVFDAAGLNVNIKSSNRLRIFDDHTQYIPKEKQKDVIQTLMIAESKVE